MAALILPSRRVVQPQGPVEVDWGNPITRGLLDAFSGVNLYSPTRNVFLTGISQKVATAGGISGDYTVAALDGSNTAPSFGGSVAENTLLVVAVPDNIGMTTRSIFGYGNSASANALCFIGQGATSAQLSYFVRSDANVAQNLEIAGGENWTQGKLAVVAGRRSESGNFHDLYLNGSLLSTAAATTIGTTTINRTAVGGLRRNSDGLYFDGKVPLSLSWNRALSVSELQSVSANPWQLFRPIQRRIWVPVAGGGGISQTVAFTLEDVSAAVSQNLSHAQSLTGTLDDVTVSISQTAQHSQALDATLDGVTFAASQTLSHSQALAATLDGITVEISQSAAPSSKDQSLAVTLDSIAVSIAQEGPASLIDTHDGFWAKEWARIRAREKRKHNEEIQERVEEIQDEIAEVEQQIVEVKQAPKPKKSTPARNFYAEQARIVEQLIARRNQLIDEEDEELLLLL